MKTYAKQIEDAQAKIEALKAVPGKGYSASLIQRKLDKLTSAIRKEDAKAAEEAVQELTGEVKAVEVPNSEVTIKDSLSKKK